MIQPSFLSSSAVVLPQALLLVGPTGSGKTPLGQHLELHGLAGRRCVHFDFGAQLRRVAAAAAPDPLSPEEQELVRSLLRDGALLDDSQFHIARKLLDAHINASGLEPSGWNVLNGLPRHTGQAVALEPCVDVRCVVALACTPETVLHRIRADTGGDRQGRADDTPEAVATRLAMFETRTTPLLDHYRRMGVSVLRIDVGRETRAEDAAAILGRVLPGHLRPA